MSQTPKEQLKSSKSRENGEKSCENGTIQKCENSNQSGEKVEHRGNVYNFLMHCKNGQNNISSTPREKKKGKMAPLHSRYCHSELPVVEWRIRTRRCTRTRGMLRIQGSQRPIVSCHMFSVYRNSTPRNTKLRTAKQYPQWYSFDNFFF